MATRRESMMYGAIRINARSNRSPSINRRVRWALALCVSLAYAFVLAALPLQEFLDRANYILYAGNSLQYLQNYYSKGLVVLLFNEPVWLVMNGTLSQCFGPETTLRVIIFISSFGATWLIIRCGHLNPVLIIGLLLYQPFMVNYVVHLREGVAITVFLLGWFSNSNGVRYILFAATPFIHVLFFAVLALYAFSYTIGRLRISTDMAVVVVVVLSLAFTISLPSLSSMFELRQAAQYDFSGQVAVGSGAAFLLWSAILALLLFDRRSLYVRYCFEINAVILYVTSYFAMGLLSRVFEAVIPLVVMAGNKLAGPRRVVFWWLFIGSCIFLWVLKGNQPWFGFGVT